MEDVSALRKIQAGQTGQEKNLEEREKRAAEIEAQFEQQIGEIAQKIFKHFDAKGYAIPEVEWFSDQGANSVEHKYQVEEKMIYLIDYGCVYPKGTKRGEKGQPYLMLRSDAPELEELYEEKIRERDNAMFRCFNSSDEVMLDGEKVALNQRQIDLDKVGILDYLVYQDKYDYEQLVNELKYLDIFYGSVRNEYFEDPKLEEFFLEILIKKFQLKTEEKFPTKEEWIRAFQNITPQIIEELVESAMKDLQWSKDEADAGIVNYLKSVRPVVKDLKETTDGFFISDYGGVEEVEPPSADAALMERAKMHAEQYKGLIVPVL